MKTRHTYLLGLMLIGLSIQLLISCSPWDLPERKTQRNCQTPGGTIVPNIQQRDVTFTISNPTGTIDNVSWNFGDNSPVTTGTSSTATVKHTYATNGTYTVRATLNNSCDNGTTIQTPITVTNAVPPTVTLQPITEILATMAVLRMAVTETGNTPIIRYGICYSSTNQMPEIGTNDSIIDSVGTVSINNAVRFHLLSLIPNTTYYVRSFAINSAGRIGYSSPQKFLSGINPIVTTKGSFDIGVTTTKVNFFLVETGRPTPTQYGIIYSLTNSTPNLADPNSIKRSIVNPNVNSNTVVDISDLKANTQYYFRSYALVTGPSVEFYSYGPIESFTTKPDAVAQDLVAHLTFSNGSLLDISGNNNHAIRVDNPTFTNDRNNNANSAIQLDGVNDYFYLADHATLRPDALTVSVWIRPNALNSVEQRMQIYNKSRWNDSAHEMYSSLIKRNDNGPGLTFMTNLKQNSGCQTARAWQDFQFSSNPQLGVWHHLVFTYSGRSVRMYFDNVLLDQNDNLPATRIDDCPGGELKFGAQIQVDPDYFSGAMDDIRIYKRALNATEVQTLFNAAN